MMSALCDGIYLRRCIEFLTGCQVEDHLLVDSSSARQVAMCQDQVGEAWSGKLLWVQQVVHEGKVQLRQVPTLCNVANAGTKPLASKRIQMSLHCIGMARRAEGDQTIGQEEYEVQFQKYSSGKQIDALAKNIARVIVFMGPEPLQGATAMPLDGDDIFGSTAQCSIEPNHLQNEGYSWMFIFMCSILVLTVLAFWGWVWVFKRANDAYTSFEHLYTQYAIL